MRGTVYVYNVVGGEMSSTLMDMASPSTVDFFVHKKLIEAGYTECVWLDECEYVFPTGTNVSNIGAMYKSDYAEFEEYLRGRGYEVIDLDASNIELI